MKKNSLILGLNTAGFNTSTSLIVDGVPVFAVEEERLIREKRTRKFPHQGIKAALEKGDVSFDEIDVIAIAWNPAINLESYNAAHSGRARFLGEIYYNVVNGLSGYMGEAGDVSEQIVHLKSGKKLHIYFIRHHLAHASAFYISPFEEAAVLTADAFGEKECTHFAHGKGGKIDPIWSQEFPHSLGSFYSTMTAFMGFQPQSDEWKLMGASSFGDGNRFIDRVRSLVRMKDVGFELDLSCFNHFQFHRPGLFAPKMIDVLGFEPNEKDKPLTQDYYDLSAAAQTVFEEIYLGLINQLHERVGGENLVLSGGSALNSVANGKVIANSPFKRVFIPPTPDDSGGSMGAAMYIYHHLMEQPRHYVMENNYLGPSYDNEAIKTTLETLQLQHEKLSDPMADAARQIADGKIIGWFQGGLEFGDRALGNRSILGDPRDASMKDKVNALIKYREAFRPFAPAILADRCEEYFERAAPTPFMEKVFQIKPDKRGGIPAVTHVDGSGRLQTVTEKQNPRFYRLISSFYKETGIPIVLNTSFNVKGEAMVCSPHDAIRTFFSSGLDVLYLGDYKVLK